MARQGMTNPEQYENLKIKGQKSKGQLKTKNF
jgi:hypothetical protein